ncbi:MAG: glycosyltransferase family 2 protein [Planctomycetes bacterium]|nr:glycosyltransferase family 2 protein [Planctomycetota bacterium]
MTHVPSLEGAKVGVVVPAFRVAPQIESVIRGIPSWVQTIIVVEDKSPDDTAARVEKLADPRVVLIRHAENQGVGGAMRSGFQEALRRKLDIVVKMDGDDQMDPAHLAAFVEPLLDGDADVTKGNRYHSPNSLAAMPKVRVIGNAGLTFMVKAASGYWANFDPANGYVALRREVLERLQIDKLPSRYFFESGLLIELGIVRAVVRDVPIDARYGDEHSSLSITKTLFGFPPRLFAGLLKRIFWRYFVYDFSAVSIFVLLGLPLFLFGSVFGAWLWYSYATKQQFASAGMVMFAAMPIILGFQMLLQAIVLDVTGVPRFPLCEPLRESARAVKEARSHARGAD